MSPQGMVIVIALVQILVEWKSVSVARGKVGRGVPWASGLGWESDV